MFVILSLRRFIFRRRFHLIFQNWENGFMMVRFRRAGEGRVGEIRAVSVQLSKGDALEVHVGEDRILDVPEVKNKRKTSDARPS